MRTIEEVIAELRKDIHSDVYLGKKTINTYLDEILEIHKAESTQGDLISREALKKVINEYIDEYSDLDNEGNHSEKWCAMKEAEMAIDDAPTVERPHGEWIPVSERLPDSAGYYCVTVKNGNDTYVTEEMWSSNFQGNNGFHNYLPVIAWCPLPEPYKEA